jgi:asparagine synthase (glutamine-hydrolysing)
MCGVACYLGKDKNAALSFSNKANVLLEHRGPDDAGVFSDENIMLLHRRLSILDLSPLGHQPMTSSCGRYVIIFNGEIYNHNDLRKKYLSDYQFRGHSDTETIIELFRIQQEKMLQHMVGMWALLIWDKETRKLFISRDRYGQKPLFARYINKSWLLSSEMKPLLGENEQPDFDPTAVVEYLALGNYGHLGIHTFFKDIHQFPQGCYAWLSEGETDIDTKKYWYLPDIREKDKVPFDEKIKKGLHDCVVEAVLSQTLSDVPIGLTLSGGIDSSIIAGILASHYDQKINVFTAQSPDSKYDESKYVDAVIDKFGKSKFILHKKNLAELSVKEDLAKYLNIQEEPFGDPSIIAHGFLMSMAADAGIKVILNGQGADEVFFGYNNMAQAILLQQFKSGQFKKFSGNLAAMKLGKSYVVRTLLKSALPGVEQKLRMKSRIKRRDIIHPSLLTHVDNSLIQLQRYDKPYNVWLESIYGAHIPHLVHYDDRNGMAYSIEGRSPFLDHRIAAYVATIRSADFLENGLRKYLLRESCRQYLPQLVYNRTDKIGFYTPLINALQGDKKWVALQLEGSNSFTADHFHKLIAEKLTGHLSVGEALQIWRLLSLQIWKQIFNITT